MWIAPLVALLLVLGACAAPGAPAPTPDTARPADCAPPPAAELPTAAGWLAWIDRHPDDVAVLVDDGRGAVVTHGADRPMPLASAVKVVHLAAYGRAAAEGRLRPDEPVAVADWERFYLPTDGGAHQAALARLRPGPTVTVDAMVSAMIQESDNAATDWLRERLGDDALVRAAADTGWAPFDLPSELGAALALVLPGQAPPLSAPRSERGPAEVALARRYAADPAFRDEAVRALTARVTTDPEGYLADNDRWAGETAVGSAAQLTGAYRALATGSFGPGADVARRHLEWRGTRRDGSAIGFKGGTFTTVSTFGAYQRRADGSLGYATILARGLPRGAGADPGGQQEVVLDALDEPQALAALRCVA